MRKISGLILFVVASAALAQDTAKPDYDKMKRDWQKNVETEREKKIAEANERFDASKAALEKRIEDIKKERVEMAKKAKNQLNRESAKRHGQHQYEQAEQALKRLPEDRKNAIAYYRQWEPATPPNEVKAGWFGKLGETLVTSDSECRVFHVFDQKSAVLTYGPFSFIVEDIDTAGLTKGGIYKPSGLWHVTGSRLVGGSNYFVLKSVK